MTKDKISSTSDNPAIVHHNSDLAAGDTTEVVDSLRNHLLIAMPALTDPYFKQSVVYLCEHDEQGAMGFIINYPVKLTLQELLKNVESISYQPEPPLLEPVFLGGPLELERGFVLHSPLPDNSQSTMLNEQLMMSNSSTILTSLGTDNAPEKYLVTLGYASWDSGQLEEEIKENNWLTVKSENDLIFNTPIEKRWAESLHRLGITPDQLSTTGGHA